MQTTYENFRYRYDKKENPYNKGGFGNFKEIFFSKIPPSMNNFRAPAAIDEPPLQMDPTSGHFVESIASPKEKIDIEMGSAGDNDYSLPKILRNLDYEYLQENLKSKEGRESDFANPLFVEGPKHYLSNSHVEDVVESFSQRSDAVHSEADAYHNERHGSLSERYTSV